MDNQTIAQLRALVGAIPTTNNRFDVLSVDDDDKVASSKPNPVSVVPKTKIPVHLMQVKNMKGRKASTNPVRGGGRPRTKRGQGIRDVKLGTVADYGVKAWNLAKHLATLINVEEKVWDVDGSSGTTLTTTTTVVNLSNIAQGADYLNRSGDSILAQEMEFRAKLTGNAVVSGHNVRIIIVSDKLQRGVDPVLGDVLQGGTSPFVQPYLEPQEGRFEILYDELVQIVHTVGLAAAGTSTDYVMARLALPVLKRKWNKHIKYQGTTGADASNWVNGLFLFAFSADATNGPSLQYTFRLRFTDN